MKAMILAAGYGTRLKELTAMKPKPLVEIAGKTLLEITLERLINFGVNEVVINVHHFAKQVIDYLKKKENFGIYIEISRENELLDTGGGLKNVEYFFDDDEPFILHNVDSISNLPFELMLEKHKTKNALATLFVQDRNTQRYFLFNEKDELCGWRNIKTSEEKLLFRAEQVKQLAFQGIHILSPKIFKDITESGAFSIVDLYLRLASEGKKIAAYHNDKIKWIDAGKIENLSSTEKLVNELKGNS